MSTFESIFGKFRYFNRTLALSVTLIAVSTFNYGFDNQAFATTQAMDPFAKRFGTYNPTTGKYGLPAQWLSLFNSLNYIGFAAGVIIGSFASARFGRRWTMFGMSCYALITATITVTSKNKEQIMAARILNYVYVGVELSVIPLYQSEIVPAQARGLVVGTYQFALTFGGIVINSICLRTSTIPDDRAWRIPVSLFYIVPSIIISLILFVPESPRWLLLKGRVDEARASLRRLRGGVFTDEQIEEELQDLQLGLEKEVERGKFVELFQGINLKRTSIIVVANFFQQATGQAFSSQYGSVYVKTLQTLNPFKFGVMNSGIALGIMLIMLMVTDKLGRRTFLLTSSVIMTCALFVMGGAGVKTPVTTSRKNLIVSMISIFNAGFASGWAPLLYVISTEIPALRLRDLTSRVSFGVNVLFNFAVNFSIPYMVFPEYAGLDSKVGFIFGTIAFLSILFTYFFVPECKGKTLEEVDVLFNSGIPLRHFSTATVTSDGRVSMNGELVKAGEESETPREKEETV